MTTPATGDGLVFPLSFAQQRLYFLHQWDPANGTYPFPVNLRLTGPLDIAALRATLADVVDRQWVLRSRVEDRDGVGVQVVGPNRFRLRYEDLRGLDEQQRAARLTARVTEEATRPFTLTGPLLRGRLVAVADDEHVLLLTFHHLVFDGWSHGVLADEMDAGYRRHAYGEDTARPAPVRQYGELAERQRRDFAGDPRRAAQEAYWRERLLPLPERLALPARRPRPETLSGRTGRTWLRLDAELSDGLAALARSCRSTLPMVLLAVYEAVLYRMSGQADFCVGGASAGRPTPESQALIGTFVNEVVYRSETRAGDTFAELLSRVRATTLGVYRHDGLPFERLVEMLAPPRTIGHHPLFQHSLAVQPTEAGDQGIQLRGLRVEDFDSPPEGSALDLAVSFHWDDDALIGSVDYSLDLWDEPWAEGFTATLHEMMRAAVADRDLRVDDLPLPVPRVTPAVEAAAAEPVAAAGSPGAGEAVMAGIWGEVLARGPVDRRDNFFDIGGDSLLALQVVAKANAAGFTVRVRDLFRWQTVADLVAGVAGAQRPAARPATAAVAVAVAGPVPLVPIQSWFLSGGPDVDLGHWNYTILYRLSRPADPRRLAAATRFALDQHDATRLRFRRDRAGRWEQFYTDQPGAEDLSTIDLTRMDRGRVGAALIEIAAHVQGELRVGTGRPLTRVVHLMVAPDDHRLLLAAHHLVTDPASTRILADDISTAYGQLTRGEPVTLLAQPSTYRDWAGGLTRLAATPEIRAEIPYWTSVVDRATAAVPVDRPDGVNDVASQLTMSFELDEATTRQIRDKVTARHGTTLTEILLATLGVSLGRWLGDAPLLIDMETQGRDDLVDGVDVTRTVGWFTALFPMVLATGAAAAGPDGLRRVSAAYRAVPHHGLGFGLLSEITGDVRAPARALGFTYLGAFDGGAGASEAFLALDELPPDTDRASWMLRRHELEVGAVIFDGRLEFSYTYSRDRYTEETIRGLGESWRRGLADLATA